VRLYRRRARDTDAHSPIAAAGAGARGALPSRPITVPVSADAIVARRAAQASIGVRSDEHQAITSPLTLEHVDAEAVSMPSPPARGPADADTQPLDWYVRSSQAVSTHALIYGPVPAPGPAPMHLAPEWVVDTAPWQPRDVDIEDDGDAGRGAGGDGLDEDRYGNDGKTDPMTIGAGAYYEKYDNAFNKSTHPALHKRFQDVVVAAVATCLKQGVVATRAQVLKQEEDLVRHNIRTLFHTIYSSSHHLTLSILPSTGPRSAVLGALGAVRVGRHARPLHRARRRRRRIRLRGGLRG
jgi:hypothetical protein